MKKLLGIVVLGLLLSVNAFALTQQSAIDNHLKGKKLEPIEGIWVYDSGTVFVIYKQGSSYITKTIRSATGNSYSGEQTGIWEKGSESYFYGKGKVSWQYYGGFFGDKLIKDSASCPETVTLINQKFLKGSCANIQKGNRTINGYKYSADKIYPTESQKSKAKKKEAKAKGASGTAFFITDKGHLITNNHVIEVCKDNSKIAYSGKDIPAKVLAKDALLDLALLKVDLKRTKFIHLSQDPPKKLQRIIAAGYPLGKSLSDDLKFTSGIISSLKGLNDDSTLIQIDAALNKGNSGGPIIDEESGELVAVAVAGLDKSETEAVNFGIKTNSVRNFLDANQLEVPVPSFFSFGIDAADILEKATVYTYCKND